MKLSYLQYMALFTLDLFMILEASSSSNSQFTCPVEGSSDFVWQRVLWKKQGYPDNYTDNRFLEALVVNAEVPKRNFWEAVVGSSYITHHLSSVVLATALAYHVDLAYIKPEVLLAFVCILASLGIAANFVHRNKYNTFVSVKLSKFSCLLVFGSACSWPILARCLQKLPSNNATALAVAFTLLHLISHNYRLRQCRGSLFAAAAAVLILTRSQNQLVVFAQAATYLHFMLLWPWMSWCIVSAATWSTPSFRMAWTWLTFLHVLCCLAALLPLSPNLSFLALFCCLFITFLCPRWFVRIQKFKAKISGPWDEAVPQMSRSLVNKLGERHHVFLHCGSGSGS